MLAVAGGRGGRCSRGVRAHGVAAEMLERILVLAGVLLTIIFVYLLLNQYQERGFVVACGELIILPQKVSWWHAQRSPWCWPQWSQVVASTSAE